MAGFFKKVIIDNTVGLVGNEIGERIAERRLPNNSEALAAYAGVALAAERGQESAMRLISGDREEIAKALSRAAFGRATGPEVIGPAAFAVDAVEAGVVNYRSIMAGWRTAVEALAEPLEDGTHIPGFNIESIDSGNITVYADASSITSVLEKWEERLREGPLSKEEEVEMGTEFLENMRVRLYDEDGKDITREIFKELEENPDDPKNIEILNEFSHVAVRTLNEVGHYAAIHGGSYKEGLEAYENLIKEAHEQRGVQRAIENRAEEVAQGKPLNEPASESTPSP